MTTRIDVIRHGEPVGGRRYRGHGVDDPLTDAGWQQMWDAVADRTSWQHITTSPLSRCLDFSQKLSKKLKIGYSVDDRFKEVGFGIWEGLSPDEILSLSPDALEHFYKDPIRNRPDGAEPLESFSHRVWQAYQEIVKRHTNENVLIVAHAGIIRVITANILGMELDRVYSSLKIEYGGILTSIIEEGAAPKLIIGSR
ncbi:MAG: histidine phosphatase family protein [Gammaproteobacteria bacterium]|nr:histidine phosphatase family protein [Gammaproteobacteria bacterium]